LFLTAWSSGVSKDLRSGEIPVASSLREFPEKGDPVPDVTWLAGSGSQYDLI
jgi:hypothetical protein